MILVADYVINFIRYFVFDSFCIFVLISNFYSCYGFQLGDEILQCRFVNMLALHAPFFSVLCIGYYLCIPNSKKL